MWSQVSLFRALPRPPRASSAVWLCSCWLTALTADWVFNISHSNVLINDSSLFGSFALCRHTLRLNQIRESGTEQLVTLPWQQHVSMDTVSILTTRTLITDLMWRKRFICSLAFWSNAQQSMDRVWGENLFEYLLILSTCWSTTKVLSTTQLKFESVK